MRSPSETVVIAAKGASGAAGLVGGAGSLRARFARNSVWCVVGSASSQVSSVLAGILVGRLLGLSQFGQLAFIQSTVVLMTTFGDMGLSLTTTKFTARLRAADPARAGQMIGLHLRLAAASGVLLAVVLATGARSLPKQVGSSPVVFAGCALLVFELLNRVTIAGLSGLEAFASTARIYAARGVLVLPAFAVGALLGGLAGVVFSMALVSAIVFAFGLRTLTARCRSAGMTLACGRALEPGVLKTSLSIWTGALLFAGSTWTVAFLLSRNRGGLEQLGLYNAADKCKAALLFLPSMLFQVTLPMLSHSHAAGDRAACRRIVHFALGTAVLVTASGAVIVRAFGDQIMAVYGPEFAAGSSVVAVTALVTIAASVYTVAGSALWALGRPAQMLAVDSLKAALLVGLCAAGMSASARQTASAELLSFTVGSLILLFTLARQLRRAD